MKGIELRWILSLFKNTYKREGKHSGLMIGCQEQRFVHSQLIFLPVRIGQLKCCCSPPITETDVSVLISAMEGIKKDIFPKNVRLFFKLTGWVMWLMSPCTCMEGWGIVQHWHTVGVYPLPLCTFCSLHYILSWIIIMHLQCDYRA